MYDEAPRMVCPIDKSVHDLFSMKSIYVFAFVYVEFMYVGCICINCDLMHTLPRDVFVQAVIDRGYEPITLRGWPTSITAWEYRPNDPPTEYKEGFDSRAINDACYVAGDFED